MSGPFRLGVSKRAFVHLLHLTLLGLIAYSNTFNVPFVFDDIPNIVENQRLRSISNIPLMFTEIKGELASRPLTLATFAVDFHIGGLNTTGYHYVNLGLHLINTALLYALVVLTAGFVGYGGRNVRRVAMVASILFIVHPVQTESVTYIVARSMLLATMFYLSGILVFARAVKDGAHGVKGRAVFPLLLLSVSLLGMASREDFVTFPLMLMLYDYFFLSGRRLRNVARNYRLHLPVTLTLGYLAFLVMGFEYRGAGFDVRSISPVEYLFTQFNVHWTYLRLLVLPVKQNLDYSYQVARTLFEFPTIFSFAGYLGLWAAAVYLARRRPVISFSMLWFLITITPASSIVPLNDVIFEHRLYLPSAGFFVLVAAVIFFLAERLKDKRPDGAMLLTAVPVLAVIVLTVTTHARNSVWQREDSLWEDVLRKSPHNARAHNTMGAIRFDKGYPDKAIEHYRAALKLKPDYAKAHSNLGVSYVAAGLFDKALEHHRTSLRLDPGSPEANYNIGIAYEAKGLTEKAVYHFKAALRLKPGFIGAYNNLGAAYMKKGDYDRAVECFDEAISLGRGSGELYLNRGRAYELLGERAKAEKDYQTAYRLSYAPL
jgi:Flp pilus assembly protein TadD